MRRVFYLMLRVVAAVLPVMTFAAVAHAQASINDCEKIQAADAYNQCLAKFGPASKSQNLEPERPGDVKGSSEEAAASAGKASGAHAGRRRHGSRRVSGGRKRLAISVARRHK